MLSYSSLFKMKFLPNRWYWAYFWHTNSIEGPKWEDMQLWEDHTARQPSSHWSCQVFDSLWICPKGQMCSHHTTQNCMLSHGTPNSTTIRECSSIMSAFFEGGEVLLTLGMEGCERSLIVKTPTQLPNGLLSKPNSFWNCYKLHIFQDFKMQIIT